VSEVLKASINIFLRNIKQHSITTEEGIKTSLVAFQLRQSLQEILDSIHDEDGRSDVAIHAPSLEKVLTILDARHVVGQYHPAMALKARIEKLEGVNAGEFKLPYF
jgi:hypothetical protein